MSQTIGPFAGRLSRRRIYLMRHGDVSYFDGKGVPIPSHDVPLNEEGRKQASAAAGALADVPLDRAISSTLARSRLTAETVLGNHGLEIETREALQEIRPGSLADLTGESIEEAVVDAFGRGLTPDSRFLGGETFGALEDRVHNCLEEIIADRDWQQLLIVAHGGVNRALLTHALGSGLVGYERLEQDAGCINIIDVDPEGRLLVRLVNYTPYSPVKSGVELTTMERLYQQFLGGR